MTASKDKHATSVHPHPGGPERRIVQSTDDGYEVVKPDHQRASAKTDTKSAAQERAKQIVKNRGGGEVTTKNKAGKIENSDTVGHGNDPHPPKDTRH
jgi:hypothetical protein